MTNAEKYYQALAEVYIAQYENHIEREQAIMVAKGVTADMISELIKYEAKHGKSEKTKAQAEKILIIENTLSMFSAISSTNTQIKLILKNYHKENNQLRNELETTKNELNAIKDALNAI